MPSLRTIPRLRSFFLKRGISIRPQLSVWKDHMCGRLDGEASIGGGRWSMTPSGEYGANRELCVGGVGGGRWFAEKSPLSWFTECSWTAGRRESGRSACERAGGVWRGLPESPLATRGERFVSPSPLPNLSFATPPIRRLVLSAMLTIDGEVTTMSGAGKG